MIPIDDGGLVFPRKDLNGEVIELGLTLRDYFIAHAPVEPWPEFWPVMPPIKAPSDCPIDNNGNEATEEDALHLHGWLADPCFDIDDEMLPGFSNWCQVWRDYWIVAEARDAEAHTQRRIQWPAYWADRMIEQRRKA